MFDDAVVTDAAVDQAVLNSDCDVAYELVAGPRWISRLDDGWRPDELVEAGGEVVCETG